MENKIIILIAFVLSLIGLYISIDTKALMGIILNSTGLFISSIVIAIRISKNT